MPLVAMSPTHAVSTLRNVARVDDPRRQTQLTRRGMRLALGLLALVMTAVGAGCVSPDRAARMECGYVYYLDGAGGGGITNWSGGVREGLRKAGYSGAGEMFNWETGLGVLADQTASNSYKRGKASELANEIVAYQKEHPGAPVTLMGLSAGTAVAVFTLEALPRDTNVENVILLSGSLSATYDLTRALNRVNGRMYVTTSRRDMVLTGLVPTAGTADRGSGTTATIGVEGPQLPHAASAETRRLYGDRLVVVPWKPEFSRYGNAGGHTDTVAAAFVQRYVAPLVETAEPIPALAASTAPEGHVENPDYRRWAKFPVGSWIVFDGQQSGADGTRPFRVKTTLIKKTADVLVLRREQVEGAGLKSVFDQTIYESAAIAPEDHPSTHPARRVEQRPAIVVSVGSRELNCSVQTIETPADFSDWGSHPQATVHTSEQVPGGIAQIDIKTRFDGKPMTLTARLVDFGS